MSKPIISIVFDFRGKATKTHAAPVYVRVTYERKHVYINTGVKLCSHQWKAGRAVAVAGADSLNARIAELYSNVIDAVRSIEKEGAFSLQAFKASMRASEAVTPIGWMLAYAGERRLADSTRRGHMMRLHKAEESGMFRTWGDFTEERVQQYDRWVRQHTDCKVEDSVWAYHKTLKAYCHKAMQAGLLKADPYISFNGGGHCSTTIRYLTDDERKRIEQVQLTGTADKVRDLFIFSCYTGLAWADLHGLGKANVVEEDGRTYVTGKRLKTGNPYKVLLLDKPLAILRKYKGALPKYSNQKVNMWLKVVAGAAGVSKNLTSHMARHTFATWALRHGTPIEVVSKLLAHKSVSVTQIYAELLQQDLDDAMIKLGE